MKLISLLLLSCFLAEPVYSAHKKSGRKPNDFKTTYELADGTCPVKKGFEVDAAGDCICSPQKFAHKVQEEWVCSALAD